MLHCYWGAILDLPLATAAAAVSATAAFFPLATAVIAMTPLAIVATLLRALL